jgi:hypothetical protein
MSINLRDIASKVQETLELTDDQFGNLNVSKQITLGTASDTIRTASRTRDIQRTSRGRRAMEKSWTGMASSIGSFERRHVPENGEEM